MESVSPIIKFREQQISRYASIVRPSMGDPPLEYLGFSLLNLSAGDSHKIEAPGMECLVLLLGGKGEVEYKGNKLSLGERRNVFEDKAHAVYLPSCEEFKVFAVKDLEVGLCFAIAPPGGKAVVIKPEDVKVRKVGKDNFYREVHDVLTEEIPAKRLLVGETFNPPGNWSSYPPHKHDEHLPPQKIRLEEIYHFRIHPQQGFALMRLYDDSSIDHALVIENKDTVIITKGYHPVVSAPGYFLYYLWILGGEERKLLPINDPTHQWVIE